MILNSAIQVKMFHLTPFVYTVLFITYKSFYKELKGQFSKKFQKLNFPLKNK